ncbi:MAG: sugar transferase [Acidimicrobiales bacterium]|nr:sugar transferase [Acidimicrobiales bacterium]
MRRIVRSVLYAGFAAIVVGLSLLHANLIADPPYSYTGTFRFGWSLLYVGLLSVAAFGFGLPDLTRSPRSALLASVGAAAMAATAISVIQLITGDALLPRFVVFGSALLTIPWGLTCAALGGGGIAVARDRVIVVGDRVDSASLRADLAKHPERQAVLTSVISVQEAERNQSLLATRVRADGANVLVLDRDAQASEGVVSQAVLLHAGGIRIRTLSLFYEEWLGKIALTELERVSLLFDIGELHRSRYSRFKRLFDVILALCGLVVLLVVTPVVVIGNLFANRGPLFYRQRRVGKNGAEFTIVKFRTMTDGPDTGVWTAEDDPRVTGFGRILRASHLDELPQVWNILRGDLAVVGPRPEQPHYVAHLIERVPFYAVRHLVRPGLTGWAQVNYGYTSSERDAIQKLQYDMYYLRHQSFALDARILARTIRSVLRIEGR